MLVTTKRILLGYMTFPKL